jgi:multiple sugar transport system substrate-binding protein
MPPVVAAAKPPLGGALDEAYDHHAFEVTRYSEQGGTMRHHPGIRIAAVVVLGLVVAAGRAGAQSGVWTLPSEPVTIGYWDTGNGTKGELIKSLIAEYQKLHPNVTIKFETDVKSDKIAVAVSTGTAPEIFEVADFNLPKFIGVQALDPLPPAAWGETSVEGVLKGYLPNVLDAMMDGGKLYGVPDQMNAHSLYINNRLFREAGLDPVKDAPKTWDDVVKLNRVLTKRRADRVVQKGWEMRYAAEHWQAQMFHILLYQAGGEMTRDGKPVFNSEAGVRALQVWKSLTVAPQVTQNTRFSPYQDFAMEQDAMTFAGPHVGPIVERISPAMKGNYTVAPLPQLRPERPATIIYSYSWTVNVKASAPQKRVAWDFIRHLSARPDLWWNIKFLQGTKGWYETPAAKATPSLPVFIQDLSVGRPLARTTNYGELQAALVRMIDRVILNNADPKQALDQAAEEFVRASKS